MIESLWSLTNIQILINQGTNTPLVSIRSANSFA